MESNPDLWTGIQRSTIELAPPICFLLSKISALALSPENVTVHPRSDNHILYFLQWSNFYNIASRFGLEHGLFPGKRINTFSSLCCWFSINLNLHEPRQNKFTGRPFLDMPFDENRQLINYGRDLFFGQFGILSNLIHDG